MYGTFTNVPHKKGDKMKITWKQKLTSRKFWAAVITFITSILVAFGVPDLTIEQVIAVISAGSVMVAYIIGEGMVDVARTKDSNNESEGE